MFSPLIFHESAVVPVPLCVFNKICRAYVQVTSGILQGIYKGRSQFAFELNFECKLKPFENIYVY